MRRIAVGICRQPVLRMHYLYERSQNQSHPLRQPDTATRCTVLEKSSFVSGYGSPFDLVAIAASRILRPTKL
jgi:hypothetical protein